MNKLNFIEGLVQDYTIVLSTRSYKHLGQISKFKTVNSIQKLNSANEISFTVYKTDLLDVYKDLPISYESYKNLINDLWDKIVDFKLVWIKELDEYYEIKVSVDDTAETIKTITGTSLCEAELSQSNIYSMEINTEADISRNDYYVEFPTVFYRDPEDIESYNDIWNDSDKTEKFSSYVLDNYGNILIDESGNKVIDEEATRLKRYNILKSSSLMHRALDKVPHYSIGHIDKSLMKEQRTFSVGGSTIYDFLIGECAEQFNCLFVFDSTTRTINVYDLYTVCNNCGYRGDDFYNKEKGRDVCPKCESLSHKNYGEDTTIFVDKNNLTDTIRLETNADNIKNCLRLSSGDELMDTAIASLNPNGSNYLYALSEYQRNDMPEELVNKIENYNDLIKENEEVYEKLTLDLWAAQAEVDKLTHTLMPTIATAEVTASTEVAKLIDEITGMKLVGLSKIDSSTSANTVSNAVKNYAKAFVMSGYVKVEIINDDNNKPTFNINYEEDGKTLAVDENGCHSGVWEGDIRITNYSDKEDVETTGRITVNVTDNYQEFMSQKILKSFAEEYDEEGSLFDVLATDDINKFKEYLTQYCKVRLESFYDAIESAILVLEESNTGEGTISGIAYNAIAPSYKEKLNAVQIALDNINLQIEEKQKDVDRLFKERTEIQKALNFETYLGDLYPIFCAYKREDTYENANYISDGLTDSQLLEKAKEFFKVAKQELAKASEPQYAISSTLYNLLVMDEFKPIVNHFELGNWIRIKIDGVLYKLRIIGYSISFDNLQTINVEFSNVSRSNDIIRDTQQILQSAQSMATNFNYVAKQAEKGNSAQATINETVTNGLYGALVQIKNNSKEEVIWDKNGILCRAWDDELDSYSPKQLRITHNIMSYTSDGWNSVRQAIGEHRCYIYNKETFEKEIYEGYGVTTDFVNSGIVIGSTIVGGIIFSNNYTLPNGVNATGDLNKDKYNCQGSFMDLENGNFSFGGQLTWDGIALKISGDSVGSAINGLSETPDKLRIKPESIDVSESKIKSTQIDSITYNQISDRDEITVKAEKIDTTINKIKKEQIESIDASQIDGITEIVTVKAENITGEIISSQIDDTLSDKTVSGTFNGSINISDVTTTDGAVIYNGVTGKYTVGGDTVFTIVNGIIVDVAPVSLN